MAPLASVRVSVHIFMKIVRKKQNPSQDSPQGSWYSNSTPTKYEPKAEFYRVVRRRKACIPMCLTKSAWPRKLLRDAGLNCKCREQGWANAQSTRFTFYIFGSYATLCHLSGSLKTSDRLYFETKTTATFKMLIVKLLLLSTDFRPRNFCSRLSDETIHWSSMSLQVFV